MLAAIHIRQTHTPTECITYAALTCSEDDTSMTRLFGRPGSTSEARYAAGLDALAQLVGITTARNCVALVHITDGGLRREISNVETSFPSLSLVDTVRGRLLSMVEQSSTAISDHIASLRADYEQHQPEELRALPELTVATDASKSSRRRGVGVACVSSEGARHQKMYPQARSVLAGELLAIKLAITQFPERTLHILTDSRQALERLRMSRADLVAQCDGEVLAIVETIRHLLHGREVRLSWVKGHSGHLLNELADRLAVSARRNYEAGVSAEIRQAIADNIMSSLPVEHAAA